MLPGRNDLQTYFVFELLHLSPSDAEHCGYQLSSLRSLAGERGSIGFHQTHVSNSSRRSNEPLGSERAGDEGGQIRKLRKRRKSKGKVEGKVREIIMEDM